MCNRKLPQTTEYNAWRTPRNGQELFLGRFPFLVINLTFNHRDTLLDPRASE